MEQITSVLVNGFAMMCAVLFYLILIFVSDISFWAVELLQSLLTASFPVGK